MYLLDLCRFVRRVDQDVGDVYNEELFHIFHKTSVMSHWNAAGAEDNLYGTTECLELSEVGLKTVFNSTLCRWAQCCRCS